MIVLAAGGLESPDVTVFLLSMAALLGLARLLGELARKFRQPAVLGEIMAGIVLGPTILGAIDGGMIQMWLFPETGMASTALQGLILLSASLLLLAAGLEVDLSAVWRQGRATLYVGFAGLMLPAIVGFAAAYYLPEFMNGSEAVSKRLPFALFVGIALSITALPVIAKILIDLGISKSDMGMLILSSAMLNDIIGWVGFALVLALIAPATAAGEAEFGNGIGSTILYTFLFIGGMLTIGRVAFHHALVYIQAKWSYPGGVLAFVMVIALVGAAFTEYIGIHSIFGAFIAGVAMGDSHHLRHRTRDMIHQFIMNFFAPLFFASIGLYINFISAFKPQLVLVIFALAFTTKVIGCIIGAKMAGMSLRESSAVGFGMTARGAMEIILGQLAYAAGLISDQLMVAIVCMALLTSLLAGPLMQTALKLRARRRLPDILSERNIVLNMTACTLRESIDELAARAAEIIGMDEKTIANAVCEREDIMSTGLPNQIAVPHARFDGMKKAVMIFGRSSQGIDFDSPDGAPARLICMLLTPSDQPNTQIELLQIMTRTLDDAATRARVLSACSRTEILATFNLADCEGAPTPHDQHTLGLNSQQTPASGHSS